MAIRKDLLLDQVERFARLLTLLIAGKKPLDYQQQINDALSELTGLGEDFFTQVNDHGILFSVLSMAPIDDQKALAALLLWQKNPEANRELARKLLTIVDKKKLDARLNEMIVAHNL